MFPVYHILLCVNDTVHHICFEHLQVLHLKAVSRTRHLTSPTALRVPPETVFLNSSVPKDAVGGTREQANVRSLP